jgi:cellulose synthase/poly-beta-1,6-N-acetylglucosamine synthase-like glycosyltransferase
MILLWNESYVRMGLVILGSYFLCISLMQVLLQALSYRRHQRRVRHSKDELPSLTLLVPARNEENVVVESLSRSLQLPLKRFDIIVVENASTDRTYQLLNEMFQMRAEGNGIYRSITHPQLRMIRSEIPGKALALNLALPFVTTDVVATMDADTIPEIAGIESLLREFQARPDVMALGGIVRVMDPDNISERKAAVPRGHGYAIQSLEYLRAFSGERLGWGLLKGNIYMSGACALFRTIHLRSHGGFQIDSVTEDLETSLELVKCAPKDHHPIDIVPAEVAWTQVPHNLSGLFHQRRRWQAGLWQCLWKYRGLFLNSKRGIVGFLAMPYILLVEGIGPLMELAAYILIAVALYCEFLEPMPVIIVTLIGLTLSGLLTIWAASVENRYIPEDADWPLIKVFLLSFPLNLIHRPIVNLVRVDATLRWPWMRSWGAIQRKELVKTLPA